MAAGGRWEEKMLFVLTLFSISFEEKMTRGTMIDLRVHKGLKSPNFGGLKYILQSISYNHVTILISASYNQYLNFLS
jgi:hypothetical protein